MTFAVSESLPRSDLVEGRSLAERTSSVPAMKPESVQNQPTLHEK